MIENRCFISVFGAVGRSVDYANWSTGILFRSGAHVVCVHQKSDDRKTCNVYGYIFIRNIFFFKSTVDNDYFSRTLQELIFVIVCPLALTAFTMQDGAT